MGMAWLAKYERQYFNTSSIKKWSSRRLPSLSVTVTSGARTKMVCRSPDDEANTFAKSFLTVRTRLVLGVLGLPSEDRSVKCLEVFAMSPTATKAGEPSHCWW